VTSYGHFTGSYRDSCSSYSFGYSAHFIKYSTWFNNGYPIFGGSLSRAHTCFCGSYCNRFVGKYTHPYFLTTTCISCHCSSFWGYSRWFFLSSISTTKLDMRVSSHPAPREWNEKACECHFSNVLSLESYLCDDFALLPPFDIVSHLNHLCWHMITKILRNGPRAHFSFTTPSTHEILEVPIVGVMLRRWRSCRKKQLRLKLLIHDDRNYHS
jgi:hypothetical protein